MSAKRVLLVEDHPTLAAAIVRFLKTREIIAVHCSSFNSAMEAVRTENWDGVICDLWLGQSQVAWPVLDALRHAPNGRAPFLLMTGQQLGEVDDSMLKNVDAIIEKPFTFPEFAAKLDTVFRRGT